MLLLALWNVEQEFFGVGVQAMERAQIRLQQLAAHLPPDEGAGSLSAMVILNVAKLISFC